MNVLDSKLLTYILLSKRITHKDTRHSSRIKSIFISQNSTILNNQIILNVKEKRVYQKEVHIGFIMEDRSRSSIDKKCGSEHAFSPESFWHMSLESWSSSYFQKMSVFSFSSPSSWEV